MIYNKSFKVKRRLTMKKKKKERNENEKNLISSVKLNWYFAHFLLQWFDHAERISPESRFPMHLSHFSSNIAQLRYDFLFRHFLLSVFFGNMTLG